MKPGLRGIAQQSLSLLDARNRRRVYLLLLLTFFTAAIEVVGIGSVAPFIAVLTNPGILQSNEYLVLLSKYLGIADPNKMLMVLAGLVIGISLTRNILFLVHQRLNSRYLALFKQHISSQTLRGYLSQPYSFFLSNSTLELQRNVIEEANNVVDGVIKPIITGITKLIMCVTIVCFIVYLRPMVALVTLLILGGFYAIIYFLVHLRLGALSTKRREYRRTRFKLANEGLNGIKSLILSGQRGTYADAFTEVSRVKALADAKGEIISAFPRYGIESIALVGLVTYAVFEFNTSGGQISSLPLMTLYLLAGYRLLPALQQFYASLSRIQFDSASLAALYEHSVSLKEHAVVPDELSVDQFSGAIEANKVSYSYPGGTNTALSSVSLSIAAGSSIALVGRSGSGKSTLVDLLLGLIQPQSGELRVDDIPLASVRSQWQQQIGYVPQQIYLADDSVAQNIAFGVEPQDIDHDAVVLAAKVADIHEHVVTELSDGYDTVIGERGTKLSGGQCQRIGIARALYRNPRMLVLDEATSALDRVTEATIMQAIQKLSADMTIVLVAHRISTVEACDRIYVLSEGRITDEGNYSSLMSDSASFRKLAESQSDESPQ